MHDIYLVDFYLEVGFITATVQCCYVNLHKCLCYLFVVVKLLFYQPLSRFFTWDL